MSGDWTGSPFPPPSLFPFALDHWFFPQLDRGCKLTEGSAHLQTWPPDLIPFCSLYCPGFSSHTFDTLFFCVSTKRQDQAAKEAGGLVCGTKLISTGIWRRKPRYPTPPTTPISPFFLSPSYSGGCLHQAACITRFVKDVTASCRFHGRLPTSPHVFCPFLIYSHFSLYPPSPVNLLMNSASFFFCYLFSSHWNSFPDRHVIDVSVPWCHSIKVGQGGVHAGQQAVCVCCTMPGCNLWAVC